MILSGSGLAEGKPRKDESCPDLPRVRDVPKDATSFRAAVHARRYRGTAEMNQTSKRLVPTGADSF